MTGFIDNGGKAPGEWGVRGDNMVLARFMP